MSTVFTLGTEKNVLQGKIQVVFLFSLLCDLA